MTEKTALEPCCDTPSCVLDCQNKPIFGSKFCKSHYVKIREFEKSGLHIITDNMHFYDNSFGFPLVFDHYDQQVHAWLTYDVEKTGDKENHIYSISIVNREWADCWRNFCFQLVSDKQNGEKKQEKMKLEMEEVFEKLKGKLAYETMKFDAMQEIKFTLCGAYIIYSPPISVDKIQYYNSFPSMGLLMWQAKSNLDKAMKAIKDWEQQKLAKNK